MSGHKALEKITGTEIYSEISVRALERKREQEETLRALNAKLDGVVLLSDEERSNYISQQGHCADPPKKPPSYDNAL